MLSKQPFVDEHNIVTPMAQKFLWGLAPQKPLMLLVSVGSSPWIYQNQDHFTGFTIAGGTVTKVEVSTDQIVWADCGSTAGLFQLQPFDSVRITHAGVPICYACYRVSA